MRVSTPPELTSFLAQFYEYNETPLFLQLSKHSGGKDLPVTIYETTVEIIDNEPVTVLVKAAYEIETGEAERVAVDHAAQNSTASTGSQSSRACPFTCARAWSELMSGVAQSSRA